MKTKEILVKIIILFGIALLFLTLISFKKFDLILNFYLIFLTILSIFAGSSLIVGGKFLKLAKTFLYNLIMTLFIGSIILIIFFIIGNLGVSLSIINLILFFIFLIIAGVPCYFLLLKPLFGLLDILEKDSQVKVKKIKLRRK